MTVHQPGLTTAASGPGTGTTAVPKRPAHGTQDVERDQPSGHTSGRAPYLQRDGPVLLEPACRPTGTSRTGASGEAGQSGISLEIRRRHATNPAAAPVPLLAVLFAATAQAACRVEPRSAVPLDVVDGHVLVTVQVNDVAATFILDTGADRTLMGEDVVRRLGLERDGWVASTIAGIGGIQQRPNALPRSLRLGTTPLRRRTLTRRYQRDGRPAAGERVAGRPIAGLLGRDFLSPFDLDIDLPGHRMTLYDVRGCDAGFLPWTTPYAAIPASTPMGAALVVQVLVDGRPLRALIDTGASASLITAPGMFRLGLTPELLARDPGGNGRGVGPAPVPMRLHRFAEMRVGAGHDARSDAMGGVGARGADRRHAARRGLAAFAAGLAVVRDEADVRGGAIGWLKRPRLLLSRAADRLQPLCSIDCLLPYPRVMLRKWRRDRAWPRVREFGVEAWLSSIGLAERLDAFRAQGITADQLSELTDDDLRELGLTIGERKRFRRAAAALRPNAPDDPRPRRFRCWRRHARSGGR